MPVWRAASASAPAGHPRRHGSAGGGADLPGSPRQPFIQRLKLKRASVARTMDWFGLVVMLVSAWRHLQVDAPIPLQGRAHMWVFGTLCAAHIAGHWVAPAGYLSAMEVSSALLRLTALSDGAWLLQRRFLDDTAPAGAAPGGAPGGVLRLAALRSGASHASLLVFASASLPMLQLGLCRPMRLWLSVLVQATLTLRCAWFAPLMCGAAPLAAPASQRLTHHAARLLDWASLFSLHPYGLARRGGDTAAQCCAVLRFLQLLLGLLAPVLWSAAWEGALFAAHQQQRRAAGLPPEQGPSAALYGLVAQLRHPVVRPRLWACGLLTLGLCWSIAAGTSRSAGGGLAAG